MAPTQTGSATNSPTFTMTKLGGANSVFSNSSTRTGISRRGTDGDPDNPGAAAGADDRAAARDDLRRLLEPRPAPERAQRREVQHRLGQVPQGASHRAPG